MKGFRQKGRWLVLFQVPNQDQLINTSKSQVKSQVPGSIQIQDHQVCLRPIISLSFRRTSPDFMPKDEVKISRPNIKYKVKTNKSEVKTGKC